MPEERPGTTFAAVRSLHRRRRSQLQQVFRTSRRFPVEQLAFAQLSPATGAGARRHQLCLHVFVRSHRQHSDDQVVGWLLPRRSQLLPSIRFARFFDRHSRVGLHSLLRLVGNLLWRQPPHQWEISRRQHEPVWRERRRGRDLHDTPEHPDLWRVALAAREGRRFTTDLRPITFGVRW